MVFEPYSNLKKNKCLGKHDLYTAITICISTTVQQHNKCLHILTAQSTAWLICKWNTAT